MNQTLVIDNLRGLRRGSFLIPLLLLVVLPVVLPIPVNFFLALGLLFVGYLVTYTPYVIVRNKAVERHQRVFTGEWVRYEFAMLANKVGIKMSAERLADYEKGAKVDLMAMGAEDDRDNQANLITARQSYRRYGHQAVRSDAIGFHPAIGPPTASHRWRVAQR